MNVDVGIWSKLTKVVVFLLFLAGLLGVAVWYLPLIRQNERYRSEVLRLDTQIQKEAESAKQLKTSVHTLQHDPKAVERLARQGVVAHDPGALPQERLREKRAVPAAYPDLHLREPIPLAFLVNAYIPDVLAGNGSDVRWGPAASFDFAHGAGILAAPKDAPPLHSSR